MVENTGWDAPVSGAVLVTQQNGSGTGTGRMRARVENRTPNPQSACKMRRGFPADWTAAAQAAAAAAREDTAGRRSAVYVNPCQDLIQTGQMNEGSRRKTPTLCPTPWSPPICSQPAARLSRSSQRAPARLTMAELKITNLPPRRFSPAPAL